MKWQNFRLIIIPVLVLVFNAGGPIAWAQTTGSISGTIVDQTSGDELIGANVMIEGTTIGSATDLDGEFLIRNVPEGTQTLIISYVGYQQVRIEVEVEAGERLELELEMLRSGLEGDEVVFSVQAIGQMGAINRQISRRTISNIVSSDRIREIPDVNAAESIGRLPGVSIQRSGGEASKVAIRGLSPQYNAITVEGIRLPATDRADRSVDLSMIAPNMLDGIEVTKANLPNQDADAIGGTVDLQLRRAPDELHTDISMEGGYNQLQGSYDNYKLGGSVSNRFLDNRLGGIINFNLESRDRSTDTYNANYDRQRLEEGVYTLRTDQLRLQENTQQRDRQGGSILLDYKLPEGRIALNSFYNTRINDEVVRTNLFDADGLDHEYELSINENELTVWSNMLAVENDFDLFNISASASYSHSNNYSPDNLYVNFLEEGGLNAALMDRNDPTTIPDAARHDTTGTHLYSIFESMQNTEEDNFAFQTNVEVPFHFGDFIDGSFEFGGKHARTERMNDEDAWGIGYLAYGGGGELRRLLAQEMDGLSLDPESPTVPNLPISDVLDEGYKRSDFLPGMDGDWPVGLTPAVDRINTIHNILQSEYEREVSSSFREDYDGDEVLWAGYAMVEFNIGNYVMFLPGFRYEHMETDYTAMRTREAMLPERGDPGLAIQPERAKRDNEFFLPMYHLQVSPTDWMDIRFARTNSITRPDYMQFSPRFSIDQYGRDIFAGNPELQPSEALNHDLSLSIYTNEIGLFSVSAFHKKVDGLIWHQSYRDRETEEGERLLDLEYPSEAVLGIPMIHTALNNENEAYYQGIEFDFQTNFWWLPSPFDGIVLSLNYTLIDSETEYPTYYIEELMIDPPFPTQVVRDSTRTGRLPNQPDQVANFQIGYDYGGFSARVSFLYQGETLQSLGNVPENDHFTEEYYRVDARVRQQLFDGFEIFANLNNINNRPDRNFQSALGGFPTYNQNYGATFDIGVRFRY